MARPYDLLVLDPAPSLYLGLTRLIPRILLQYGIHGVVQRQNIQAAWEASGR